MSQTVAPDTASGREMLFSKWDLRRLLIPLMIEQTLALTVGMIDTIMIASAGESAVSGVSLVESINVLLITIFTALGAGGAIVAGQYLGMREREKSIHAAKQLVMATFFLSTCIAIFCVIFNEPALSVIFGKIDADVMGHARTYFYITALSYPFIAVYNSAASLFRGMGNSKIAMVNAFIMNVVNIIGNAIFIFGMGWGVFGAALATLLSRMIAAVTMVWMLRNPDLVIHVRHYRLRDIDFEMIKRIMRIGIPNSLENSMFQIGKIILVSLVTLYGTTALTANAVGNSIAMIAIIPGSAIGMALIAVISQCVGAAEYGQAKYYTKYLLRVAYQYLFLVNVAILLLLKPILAFYQLSPETSALAYQILVLHSVCAMVFWPLSFALPNAFRAAGDVKYTMVVSIISMWACRVGLSYFFSYFFQMGLWGVWIAMIADWIVRGICFVSRYVSGRWQKRAVE